jgi:hypothetical protein
VHKWAFQEVLQGPSFSGFDMDSAPQAEFLYLPALSAAAGVCSLAAGNPHRQGNNNEIAKFIYHCPFGSKKTQALASPNSVAEVPHRCLLPIPFLLFQCVERDLPVYMRKSLTGSGDVSFHPLLPLIISAIVFLASYPSLLNLPKGGKK